MNETDRQTDKDYEDIETVTSFTSWFLVLIWATIALSQVACVSPQSSELDTSRGRDTVFLDSTIANGVLYSVNLEYTHKTDTTTI